MKNQDYRVMMEKQVWDYETKLRYAKDRAMEFYIEIWQKREQNVHISVGGLDSLTLLFFLRDYCDLPVPAISVSSLEHQSIQTIHKQLGVERIKPFKNTTQVIKEFGFPVISKAKAKKISLLQTPDGPKQTFIHAIMTGQMGENGMYVGIDNTTGNAWVAEFPTLAECERWLRGEEPS